MRMRYILVAYRASALNKPSPYRSQDRYSHAETQGSGAAHPRFCQPLSRLSLFIAQSGSVDSLVDIVGEIGRYICNEESRHESNARKSQSRKVHDLKSMGICGFCGNVQGVQYPIIHSRNSCQCRLSAVGDSQEQVWKAAGG